jgi:tripartite-type tricarboxylate transporter receptor subunit TctC
MARGRRSFRGSAPAAASRGEGRRLRRLVMASCSATVVALAAAAPTVSAQEAAPFYRGKTIRIVISTGVAGGYAEYARLLADHMGAHIAGQPGFIVQSMPGAGGLLAANYLYAQAPQDGTTFGIVHSSIPLTPLWGNKGVRFDSLKFNWLGSLDRVDGMCIAWHTSAVKTWTDLLTHEFTVGSSGAGSQMDIYPAMLNRLFGTRFKVIAGYKDGTDVYLAMERGEIDGRCGGQLTVIKSTRPQWLTEHKITVPILIAEKRSAEFPDTPTIMEFVKDEATRQQLALVTVSQNLDRPVMLPPGVPAARVKELREAFDATMADAAFRADVDKKSLHVDPVRGEEMGAALARAFALPPEVIAGARELMGGK